jgi:hypothetical protein
VVAAMAPAMENINTAVAAAARINFFMITPRYKYQGPLPDKQESLP